MPWSKDSNARIFTILFVIVRKTGNPIKICPNEINRIDYGTFIQWNTTQPVLAWVPQQQSTGQRVNANHLFEVQRRQGKEEGT